MAREIRLAGIGDHFEDKVGAIIVVRNTSTRLPQKALKKILGVETIVLLIRRIKRCKNLDCIVLATSNEESDDLAKPSFSINLLHYLKCWLFH